MTTLNSQSSHIKNRFIDSLSIQDLIDPDLDVKLKRFVDKHKSQSYVSNTTKSQKLVIKKI